MNFKIKTYKLDQYLIFLMTIFTFGIIGSKTLEIHYTTIFLEISLVVGSLFFLRRIIKFNTEKENYIKFIESNKLFTILLSVFSIFTISKALSIDWTFYPYIITKLFPYILFFLLLVYLKNEKKEILGKYINFIVYIYIIVFLLAIIMYLLGYTNGALSLSEGIHLVSKKECLGLYGEKRLYWILSHKSRFSVFCMLSFLFVIKSNISKKIKTTTVILSFLCILLSNSMTGILLYIILIIFYFFNKYKVFQWIYYSKNTKKIFIAVILISLIIALCSIIFLNGKRDIKTMGSRTIIWEASIKELKKKPFGRVKIPDKIWMKAEIEGKNHYFTNGHNIYINEMLENGIVLGIVYLLINIVLIIKIIKSQDYDFAMFMFLTLFVFGNLESINSREMNYILFLAYGIFYSLANKKENLILVRGRENE